ncbi:MAG: S-methyl-5'-thioadenosine phosphorylase [bacterium]
MEKVRIGVIGGSGVYDIEGIKDIKEVNIKTPFGNPSDAIVIGTIEGKRVGFLPRHGRGHRITPSEVNYRANIYAMKTLGVENIISVSAVGSLREELKPRDFVIPDQLFDRTRGDRKASFFGDGIVAHVSFADPFCKGLGEILYDGSEKIGVNVHRGGTYVCMEGPMFSTRAESHVYRELGFSIIGMTNIPEAKLAREAEICYATVALVTDYDVWHVEEDVSLEMVLANLMKNVENVKKLLKAVIPRIPEEQTCECAKALATAIVTQADLIPEKKKKDLEPIIGKYVK